MVSLAPLYYYGLKQDTWWWFAGCYPVTLHLLALLNNHGVYVVALVDTISLFNLGGVNTLEYRTPEGALWIALTSLLGIGYWIVLLAHTAKRLGGSTIQHYPLDPSVLLSGQPVTGHAMLPPVRNKRKQ